MSINMIIITHPVHACVHTCMGRRVARTYDDVKVYVLYLCLQVWLFVRPLNIDYHEWFRSLDVCTGACVCSCTPHAYIHQHTAGAQRKSNP